MRAFSRPISAVMVSPSARAAKVSAMRCLRTGSARATHIIDGRRETPFQQRAGAHRQHQRLAGARARTPGDQLADVAAFGTGTGGAHEAENGLDDGFADRQTPHEALRRDQILAVHGRLRARLLGAGRLEQDAALGLAVGIVDVDLHQEAVELRFGQRIGAFLLQRVLGGEHVERAGQIMARARDRDMLLLHGLQQRRLGARTGAVDLVGHQQLGENRTGNEAEAAPAALAFLQHLGAENVGRHQVGSELDPARVEAERRCPWSRPAWSWPDPARRPAGHGRRRAR